MSSLPMNMTALLVASNPFTYKETTMRPNKRMKMTKSNLGFGTTSSSLFQDLPSLTGGGSQLPRQEQEEFTAERVLDILAEAEDIMNAPLPQEDPTLPFSNLEPLPLGPQGITSLVTEVALEDVSNLLLEAGLVDIFNQGESKSSKKRKMPFDTSIGENNEMLVLPLQPSSFNRAISSSTDIPATVASSSSPVKKTKKKISAHRPSNFDATSSTNDKERFRHYQFDQWQERFNDLKAFKEQEGHCLVPHCYPTNQQLAQWVKRQRYQYKLKQQGQHSTLTNQRLTSLQELGFVWHSHHAAWYEKYELLKQFKSKYGNCMVPSNYTDRSLAIWVKCQRRQYKLWEQSLKNFDTSDANGTSTSPKSTMTTDRIALLNDLDFDWNPRNLIR